jgi:hypothetical protein
MWCGISDSSYRTLQVVQNKCLRVITNSERGTPIRHLHDRTGLLMMQTYTGHTQKNGAVLIVNTIKNAPFFCVCPV